MPSVGTVAPSVGIVVSSDMLNLLYLITISNKSTTSLSIIDYSS